jgi:Ala-tRNA(Pro) deacylase
MAARKLTEFLDREHVSYITLTHSETFTAQETAQSAHVSGKEMAKTIVVHLGDKMAMAVLPANQKIALADLRAATGGARARFATEDEFRDLFPDCELGAMPPFGNLYGMDVFMAAQLEQDEQIAFNAGSHTELIRMPLRDFERLVKPTVANFSM